MKDKIGQDLAEGDTVVFNPPMYKGIVFGKVIGFTPKKVKLNYSHFGHQMSDETMTEFYNVVKVNLDK